MKHMSTAEVTLTISEDQGSAILYLKPDEKVCCHECAIDFMLDFLTQVEKKPSPEETQDLH
jgi:hypothetical protein